MQKISFGLIFLGAVSAVDKGSSPIGSGSCYNSQIAFAFGDIKTVKDIEHPNSCQQQCQEEAECRFYTYFAATQECVLKDGDAIKSSYFYKGAYSGPKECNGVECNKGYEYINDKTKTKGDCTTLCWNTEKCKDSRWEKATGKCSLRLKAENKASVTKRCWGMECAPPVLSPCIEPSIAYMDLETKSTRTENLAGCSKACDDDLGCEVFTFHRDGRCWLGKIDERTWKQHELNTVSGRKNCCLTPDVEYQGLDYMNITEPKSQKGCRSECLLREECAAWNLRPGGVCNLKRNINGFAEAKGVVSGSRMCCFEEQIDYYGGDIDVLQNTTSPQECQLACKGRDECKYFTWNLSHKCSLKRAECKRTIAKNVEAISGSKTCCDEPGISYKPKGGSRGQQQDFDKCIKDCIDESKCSTVMLNNSTKVCWKQETIEQRSFNKDMISAVAYC